MERKEWVIKMDILRNLSHRLSYDEADLCPGGEEDIEKVIAQSPVPLPEDYLALLKEISGEGSWGIEFGLKNGDENSTLCISIYSAYGALEKCGDWEFFGERANKEFFSKVWVFGDDLGDLIYFFGEGQEGFGLYVTEDGVCDLKSSHKLADTLTDLLVHGVGIDAATGDY